MNIEEYLETAKVPGIEKPSQDVSKARLAIKELMADQETLKRLLASAITELQDSFYEKKETPLKKFSNIDLSRIILRIKTDILFDIDTIKRVEKMKSAGGKEENNNLSLLITRIISEDPEMQNSINALEHESLKLLGDIKKNSDKSIYSSVTSVDKRPANISEDSHTQKTKLTEMQKAGKNLRKKLNGQRSNKWYSGQN